MNNRTIIIILLVCIAVVFVIAFSLGDHQPEEEVVSFEGLIQCLAANNIVIYGTNTCPACAQLINSLGGYQAVEPIYVECNQETEQCIQQMKTNYVPEIQVNGELYTGSRDPQDLAEQFGCQL
mgnify:CR=1 FL=1|jgi:glutaredoxin